jgi:hypothetical protein
VGFTGQIINCQIEFSKLIDWLVARSYSSRITEVDFGWRRLASCFSSSIRRVLATSVSSAWRAVVGYAHHILDAPQTFRLALVTNGRNTEVEYLELDADNYLEIPIDIGGSVSDVTLVVVGTTRFTVQPASYQIDFLP